MIPPANKPSFVFFLGLLLILACAPFTKSFAKDSAGRGFVDSATIDGERLLLQGWAAAQGSGQQVVSLTILLDDQKIQTSAFERWERPDVAEAFKRKEWLRSGWRVSAPLNDAQAGSHKVKVIARLDSGVEFELASAPAITSIDTVDLNAPKVLKRNYLTTITVAGLIALFLTLQSPALSRRIGKLLKRPVGDWAGCAIGLLFLFAVLVGLGTTGSSVNLLFKQTPLVSAKITNLFGQDQPVRSDEWLVLTPLSIAQFNDHFPVINRAYGEDGQNMLIIGMTGAPVWHLSSLAKPATWGYFFFDLRRALAWHWWFPAFACLFSLWAALGIVNPDRWRTNLGLALIFTLSPYSAAWSFWPAYAAFFPCAIFVLGYRLLISASVRSTLVWATLLGLAAAGFVFVLYPPWQVSLGYMIIGLSLATLIEQRLFRNLDLRRSLGFVLAVLVAGMLIYSWANSAIKAITLMQETVYPGQRDTIVGGNLGWPQLLRGFTNLTNLQELKSPFSNPSEISSYFFLFLPALYLYLTGLLKRKSRATEHLLFLTLSFVLLFAFVSIPEALAKYSQWGRVPTNRVDLCLGLGLTFFFARSLGAARSYTGRWAPILAILVAGLWSGFVIQQIGNLDPSLTTSLPFSIQLAIAFVIWASGYMLINGNAPGYILLMGGLTLSSVAFFNPLNIAPKKVELSQPGASLAKDDARYLALDNYLPAMALAAAGEKVTNGIFYYPQLSLWSRLDPQGKDKDIYNRYQHLIIDPSLEQGDYEVQTPRPDVVKLQVNPATFDFGLTGATRLLSPPAQEANLSRNPSLSRSGNMSGWLLYDVH